MRLVRHPSNPPGAIDAIDADVERLADGALRVGFHLRGSLARVRIPGPRTPRFVPDLWRHTCCELFVGRDDDPAYHELNFSPSGDWAVFAFRGYRDGAPVPDAALAPRIVVRATTDALELDAVLARGTFPPRHASARLRVGLSAVVEDHDGALSYWALCHPPGKPDFHHDTAFALRLEPPASAC